MRYYKMADRLFGTFFGLATNMFWKKKWNNRNSQNKWYNSSR